MLHASNVPATKAPLPNANTAGISVNNVSTTSTDHNVVSSTDSKPVPPWTNSNSIKPPIPGPQNIGTIQPPPLPPLVTGELLCTVE